MGAFAESERAERHREFELELREVARRAEEASASLETTRLALRAASAGTFEWELATGVVGWSDELARIHGVDPRAFDSTVPSWRNLVVEADRERTDRDAALAMESERHTSSEFRIRRPSDGEIRWLQTESVLVRDAAGAPARVVGLIVDITERKAMELALRRSLERHRITFEQAAVGMAEVSLDGSWLRVNARLCEIVGYGREELAGRTLAELTHPEDRANDEARAAELLSGARSSFEMEKRFVRKDGDAVWTFVTVALVRDPAGDPDYFIASVEDIEARRGAEEARRTLHETLERRVAERTAELEDLNRELEAFSYSISHDLRAPLRAIAGFALALEEHVGEGLDEEGRDYLERVQKAASRMSDLIADLLSLSRVARAPVDRVSFDVSALVDAFRNGLDEDRTRRVKWEIAPGVRASADPRLVQVALEKLLENALKFSGEKADTSIAFGVEARDGERVYFVRDEGVGFDLAHARHLFAPFQRLHSPGRFEGTGIGLATVQRIVHRHGGRIWAEAKPDAGAVFCFTLEPRSDEVPR